MSLAQHREIADEISYKEFIYKNRIHANRIINRILWGFLVTGPLIALGVAAGIFTDIRYTSCGVITLVLAAVAAVNTMMLRRQPENTLASMLGLIVVDGLLVFMEHTHVGIYLTFFLVPLLSLLFCERKIFLWACGINYVFMGIAVWSISDYAAGYNSYYDSAVAWFISHMAGATIETIVMMIAGSAVCREILFFARGMYERQLGEEEGHRMIDALTKVFYVTYYIDLANDTFKELNCVSDVHDLIGSEGCASETLELMIRELVVPEQQESMRMFLDMSTVDERLKTRSYVKQDWEGYWTTDDWSQAYLVAGDRDEKDHLKYVFLAVRRIKEEKIRELAAQRAVHEARERAENASRAKSAFLFNMSHDIRTPMNAILGYADLLEQHAEEPEQRSRYLGFIKTSGAYLMDLLNNVLEMARIESGKAVLEESAMNLKEFEEDVAVIFTPQYQSRHLKVTREVEIEHWDVWGDVTKYRQILLNVIGNAIKYTNEGGSIRISMKEIAAEGQKEGRCPDVIYVRTEVEDTGVGMSKEFLPHVFDSFAREKTLTENKVFGVGLGMGIVKNLVELMGGEISVESELNMGTKVSITIPMRTLTEEEKKLRENTCAGGPEAAAEEPAEKLEGLRLLVAEDNELNRELIADILMEEKVNCECAENGQQCLLMLQEKPAGSYDAILMDIQMPVMDGYEAARQIRRLQDPALAQIPIIALTANVFEEDRRKAAEAGMNGFAGKPIEVEELFSEIRKCI